MNYAEIFKPLIDLFTQSQVHTILLAWLPTKLEYYLTGIMAVDMFITSVIASGLSTLSLALYRTIMSGKWSKNDKCVTVQIEYYTQGKYGYSYASEIYEGLSWLVSQQTKQLEAGSFIIQPADSTNKDDDDDCAPPGFHILPEKEEEIVIEYKGRKFNVEYRMPEKEKDNNNNNNNNNNSYYYSRAKKAEPSIYLTTVESPEDTIMNVDVIGDFLKQVVRSYLESIKSTKVRSRYERNEDYWYSVQSLSSIRGLDTVALDESFEELLKKELETFINDKEFYQRIGMPYRRGILLYGKPGTGKTSLINAISAQLSRDLYYLNLKDIKDDNGLSAAFSDVPENQIIVLEDVDTQSKVLHKRTGKSDFSLLDSVTAIECKDGKVGPSLPSFSQFSLSTFLGCLDGHILSEGNIIIMTTNHVEHLDPACIRPGRMDVHLDLAYCTHYQIRKMFKNVVENPEIEFPQDILEKIPERLIPPCEVMMTMVLYRNEVDVIPQKIYELVAKYENMKPEEQMEEEGKIEDENKEKKEQVTDEHKKDSKEEEKKEETIKTEEVKKEVKKEVEIIKSEEIGEKGEINSKIIKCTEDEGDNSDSNTDVELEDGNDNIKNFKILEETITTITPQVVA